MFKRTNEKLQQDYVQGAREIKKLFFADVCDKRRNVALVRRKFSELQTLEGVELNKTRRRQKRQKMLVKGTRAKDFAIDLTQ